MANKIFFFFFFILTFAVFQMMMNIHLLKFYEKTLDDPAPNEAFSSMGDTDRPWMIIHVGPPKTGTTTIQTGLTLNSPSLASLDNVFYMGQSSSGVQKEPKIERIRYIDNATNDNNNGTLSLFPAKYLFLGDRKLFQTLESYRKQNHNVLISSEHYTSKIPEGRMAERVFNRIFKTMFLNREEKGANAEHIEPWVQQKGQKDDKNSRKLSTSSIRKTRRGGDAGENRRRVGGTSKADGQGLTSSMHVDQSSRFGFNVKIVVNYRHYFQWLPSYYFQTKIMNERSDNHSLTEYIEDAIDSLGSEYFFDNSGNTTWLQTLPPGLRKVHGSLWSYTKWTSPLALRNRVEIFDLHQQHIILNETEALQEEDSTKPDLFQSFVCQALPDAIETCSKVHDVNETLIVRARAESGPVSSLETGKLSDTQLYKLKFAAMGREAKFTSTYDVDPDQSVFRFRRFAGKVENYIRANFYDWVEERRASSLKDDHRQLCLSEESTLALKNISWNMLRHLEALVTIRDKNIQEKGSEELNKIFKAPDIHRPKYPLLLSPQKYAHESNSEKRDEQWWVPIKRNHDSLFKNTVESGAYCELDLDRLLADENFVRQVFFRSDDFRGRKNSAEYRRISVKK